LTEDVLEKEGELNEKEQAWELEKTKLNEKASKFEQKFNELKSEFDNLSKQND